MQNHLWRSWGQECYGGSGFSLACEDFGRMFNNSFPPVHFFSQKWRLGRAYRCHSLGQDQFTVAQQAETTVAECSLTSRI